MTNNSDCDCRKAAQRLRSFRRVIIGAGLILCVDLAFVACSGQTDTLELVESQETADAEEDADAGDSTAVDPSAEDGSDTASDTSASGTSGDEAASAPDDENTICVYVCGAVILPGVYELPEGTRVYEAVDAAGGFAEDADETYVNQALILSDQARLYIPTKTETSSESSTAAYGLTGGEDSAASAGLVYTASDDSSSTGSGSDSPETDADSKINLNTASQEELETLPGIGETKAAAIIAYRKENGDFSSIEDIQNVSGIGEATYENLKDLITVD